MIFAGSVEKWQSQDFVDDTGEVVRSIIRFIDAVKLIG